jgi:hypothetical protein
MQVLRLITNRRLIPWLLAGAGIALVWAAVLLPTYSLTNEDKVQATRAVVGWIVEDKSLPGSVGAYQGAKTMASRKRFIVTCDFLPGGVPISADQRVQRVSLDEYNRLLKEQFFRGECDYLLLEVKEDAGNQFVLEASNLFGPLGGHGYRFVFRKNLGGFMRTWNSYGWRSNTNAVQSNGEREQV